MNILLWFYRIYTKIFNLFKSYKNNKIISYYKNNFGLKIGKHTYGYDYRTFFHLNNKDNATIIIGDYCSLGGGLKIFASAEHNYKRPSTFPFSLRLDDKSRNLGYDPDNFSKGSVIIGNDVWIGDGVTILSGVKIGDGSVIGAGTIVSKDIPPYAIVVGNPAKVIKYRFTDDIIKKLLSIKWWEWEENKINENYLDLIGDIDEFIVKYSK